MLKGIGQAWLVVLLAVGSLAASRETSLVEATKANDATAVRALLRRGHSVNASDTSGTTPLQWAVHHNDADLVDQLLRAGADVKAASRYGVRALSLAAENGNAAVLEMLLKAGADPETALPGGETALMTASRVGIVDAMRVLIAAGAKVNAEESSRGQTALMWAAYHGNADAVRLLLEAGANLRARTDSANHGGGRPERSGPPGAMDAAPTGFSPLLFAIRAGRLDAVRVLLDGGADPNDTLSAGQSTLVVAAANAHWDVADLLLDRGANPNLAGAGWNALHQLVRARRMTNVGAEIPSPIPTGNVDSLDVARKMIARGVDVNARMSKNGLRDGQRNRLLRLGATAFFLAARSVDVEMMQLLLSTGANALTPNAEGTTPLMVAAGLKLWNPGQDSGTLPGQEPEALAAVKLCVEAGNEVTGVNDEGETALHGAAYSGNNLVVDYLVGHGAKLDAKDVREWTPLAIANGMTYTAFFKSQEQTAKLLRTLMQARGLSIEGHQIPSAVCYDCFSVMPDQDRVAIERWTKMQADFAAGKYDWQAVKK